LVLVLENKQKRNFGGENKLKNTPECTTQDEHPIILTRHTDIIDTQTLRKKWITELDDLFDIANLIAKGTVDQQEVGGKLQSITPKERQMWAQVTANIGQVMGNLAKAHDETQFNDDFARLEELINQVKAMHHEAVAKQEVAQSSS
jgi:hypothetical protein